MVKEYSLRNSAEHRQVLQNMIASGVPAGIIGYASGKPVGWCSIAPRESCSRIARSRTIPRIEGQSVWSIVCFFLDRSVRGRGLTVKFINAAVDYARAQGATQAEAYPVEPELDADGNQLPATSYRLMGYSSLFEKAGFLEVTPEGAQRKVFRYRIS